MATATPYQQLEQEFRRLHAFRGVLALLRWDAAITMPRASADVRGDQLAALEIETHTLLVSPRISRLLDRADAGARSLAGWQAANLREMRRLHDHAIATPQSLISRMAKAFARSESRWREAREANDFNVLAPQLEETVKLVRSKAELLGQRFSLDPWDALADEFTPGLLSRDIESIFTPLAQRLPGLVTEAIEMQAAAPALPIEGRFSASRQRGSCTDVMKALGFPFDRGRFDESDHPFTEGVPGDIRVTTRFVQRDAFQGLLGALHETGQALYDLGLPAEWVDQPVGQDRGMAIEESQSLLLEMMVGRSRAFVTFLRPLLEKHYGAAGPEWTEDNLYRHLNRVARGTSRKDADELTYQTHIWMRYELERRLLSGELAVKDLRDAWNALSADRLGLVPANDVEGCLQDIHWAIGSFGHFPSYGVGAVIAGQLWETIREQHAGHRGGNRRGAVRQPAGVAARARARDGREPRRTAARAARDRPAAVRRAVPALPGAQVPRGILECRHDSGDHRNLRKFPPPRGPHPRPGRKGDRGLQHDRGGRPRDGLPVRRQGFVHAPRHAALAAARRARGFRALRREPRPEAARLSRARAARLPRIARRALAHHRAGHLFRRPARDPRGAHAMRAVQPPAPGSALPLRAGAADSRASRSAITATTSSRRCS